MSEVNNGEQKEHKRSYYEIFCGGQKLHKCFSSLLIRGKFLLTCSYIGELRNGRKFKCENRPFIVFILILRGLCSRFDFVKIQFELTAVGMNVMQPETKTSCRMVVEFSKQHKIRFCPISQLCRIQSTCMEKAYNLWCTT